MAQCPKFVIQRSEATWESRSTMLDRGKAIGETVTAFPRLPRRLRLLAMTIRGAGAVLAIARTNRSCSAGSGMPLPYNGWCGRRSATKPASPVGTGSVLTAAGTSRQCLPEIATGAKRPRNDKSGAITVLAIARANRSSSAGPGCPLPYSASSAASRHFPLTLLSPNRGSCRRPLPSRGDFFRAARPSYAAGS